MTTNTICFPFIFPTLPPPFAPDLSRIHPFPPLRHQLTERQNKRENEQNKHKLIDNDGDDDDDNVDHNDNQNHNNGSKNDILINYTDYKSNTGIKIKDDYNGINYSDSDIDKNNIDDIDINTNNNSDAIISNNEDYNIEIYFDNAD